MRRTMLMVGLALLLAAPAWAQTVIPIRYRVTRQAPGQPALQHVFAKSAMACDLPVVAIPNGSTLRIEDPERPGRDCEWIDTAGVIFAGMVREVAYTYTIAGQANDIDPYGPESAAVVITLPRIPQIPGAPTNPRLTPPTVLSIAAVGTVRQRFYQYSLDIARARLDDPVADLNIAAASLTVPGYDVQVGDRVGVVFWREP